MKLTEHQLHRIIESVIPDFGDADLYNSYEVIDIPYTEQGLINHLKRCARAGYITLDNPVGHEMYYWTLENYGWPDQPTLF